MRNVSFLNWNYKTQSSTQVLYVSCSLIFALFSGKEQFCEGWKNSFWNQIFDVEFMIGMMRPSSDRSRSFSFEIEATKELSQLHEQTKYDTSMVFFWKKVSNNNYMLYVSAKTLVLSNFYFNKWSHHIKKLHIKVCNTKIIDLNFGTNFFSGNQLLYDCRLDTFLPLAVHVQLRFSSRPPLFLKKI